MNVSEGDYIISKGIQNPKKNVLLKVTSVREKEFDGLVEHNRHLEEEELTVYPHHVLVNLGSRPNPELKSVAGVDVRDIFRKTIHHDIWGPVHFFTKPAPEVMGALKKSLDTTGDKILKLGLRRLFIRFYTEIRYQRGKYAGMYKHRQGPKKTNHVHLYLKNEHASEMNYVLFHEFGHVIRFNLLTDPRVHSSWISKFNSSIQVDPIEASEFTRLYKKMIKSEVDKCSKFFSSLEDDREKLVFQQALRFIGKIHHVGKREITSLLAAGKHDVIEEIWPTRDIETKELTPIVSEYATKNPEELFAESFAFYMTGKKLPKSIHALLEKSLAFAKDNSGKLEDKNDDEDEDL